MFQVEGMTRVIPLVLERPGKSEGHLEEVTGGRGLHGFPGHGRNLAFYSKCEGNPPVGESEGVM